MLTQNAKRSTSIICVHTIANEMQLFVCCQFRRGFFSLYPNSQIVSHLHRGEILLSDQILNTLSQNICLCIQWFINVVQFNAKICSVELAFEYFCFRIFWWWSYFFALIPTCKSCDEEIFAENEVRMICTNGLVQTTMTESF